MSTTAVKPFTLPTHPIREYADKLAATEPIVRGRIRINHSRTQRDGWQYESTAEVEWEGTTEQRGEALAQLAELLETARTMGEFERDIRNTRDRAAS